MTMDWLHFTPWTAMAGGGLIGLGGALLLLCNGRIAGISGIVGGLLPPARSEAGWRLAFLAGLALAPWLYRVFSPMPVARIEAGWPLLAVAGLLVGFGTRLGAGCTSGHGVCGLSRLSPRSLVATLGFMGAGFCTVYLVRHLLAG